MKRLYISMDRRYKIEGLIFVSPFIIGLLIFFVFPLFLSIKLSFGEIEKFLGFHIKWLGFNNYINIFVNDVSFIPLLFNVVKQTFLQVPLIIVFSLLLAVMMNKKIKFRGFFRTALFLPFLLGTGFVMQQLLGQDVNKEVMAAAKAIFIPQDILTYLGPKVAGAVDGFFGIISIVLWNSSVQILLFLSGLQGIPISLYESAKVEGATEWEMFWKITLPMISPIMMLNMVYTLINSYMDTSNPVLAYMRNYMAGTEFEYAAAIGWVYFIFILILVMIIMLVFGGKKGFVYITDVKGAVKK